ncbi:MAG: glycosyltransferase family 4 protein [Chloroflexi bacterium]|nr:glycosyltransferase family 4 protein [Chloroflexota bacterium]
MRVLMLSWEYPPFVVGGLGKAVAELVPALVECGVQIHLVTSVPEGTPSVENDGLLTVHRIPTPNTIDDFYQRAEYINELLYNASEQIVRMYGPFDLVHTHDWLTSFAAIRLKNAFHLPLLATIHATERGRGHGTLGSEMAQRVNSAEWQLAYESWRVICCTEYMRQELMDYLQVPNDKIDVIYNGIDPAPFAVLYGTDLAEVRLRYANPSEKLVFFVGRMVSEKGAAILVRSAVHVLNLMPNVRFVLAGRGPELSYVQSLIHELWLDRHVMLAGFISDEERNRIFAVSDCAVFPSLYEPFGIVALEAMAARVPVVVSDVGGLKEVVKHGETGITIYPNSPESCAWGILHTLQHPEWATQRVENAYREVLTTYNWKRIAEQTRAVMERITAERRFVSW